MAKFVLAMLQQKGGSGKTVLSVNLACSLSLLHPHLKIAVADADPQASASVWIKRGNGAAGITAHRVAVDGEGKSLKDDLEKIDADVIIIDLPPALDSISLRAAMRAHLIMIPVIPSIIDIAASAAAVAIAKEAIELTPSKQYLIIPNRVENNTSIGRELRGIIQPWGPLSDVTICKRIAFQEAAAHGVGVSEYAPDSPAAREIRLLAEQVTELLTIK